MFFGAFGSKNEGEGKGTTGTFTIPDKWVKTHE